MTPHLLYKGREGKMEVWLLYNAYGLTVYLTMLSVAQIGEGLLPFGPQFFDFSSSVYEYKDRTIENYNVACYFVWL
jgi:hypothetical protein